MINAAIPMQFQGFDAGQAIERAQNVRLRDLAMQTQQEQIAYQRERDARADEAAQREAMTNRAKAMAKIAGNVTDETTYQRARMAAQNMGFDISEMPANYDPEYVAQKQFELGLASEPEKLTAFQQELAGANIQPGSPEYLQFIRNKYAPVKYVVDQGYGYTAIDPMGGAPVQGGVPPLPPGFELEGGQAATPPANFP